MKKIYRVMWYNEDDFGVTNYASAVVQADDELEAKNVAALKLRDKAKTAEEAIADLQVKYKTYGVDDLTDSPILYASEGGFFM